VRLPPNLRCVFDFGNGFLRLARKMIIFRAYGIPMRSVRSSTLLRTTTCALSSLNNLMKTVAQLRSMGRTRSDRREWDS
jgi:hypothetical protein